jgi:hypothetical protein
MNRQPHYLGQKAAHALLLGALILSEPVRFLPFFKLIAGSFNHLTAFLYPALNLGVAKSAFRTAVDLFPLVVANGES